MATKTYAIVAGWKGTNGTTVPGSLSDWQGKTALDAGELAALNDANDATYVEVAGGTDERPGICLQCTTIEAEGDVTSLTPLIRALDALGNVGYNYALYIWNHDSIAFESIDDKTMTTSAQNWTGAITSSCANYIDTDDIYFLLMNTAGAHPEDAVAHFLRGYLDEVYTAASTYIPKTCLM